LAVMAFFFAMRSCKYMAAWDSRRTKTLDMGHAIFPDSWKRILQPKFRSLWRNNYYYQSLHCWLRCCNSACNCTSTALRTVL
jgi:hypothetical protein